jgi:hypothetical protein
MMTKLLPPEKHLISVGFATAFAVSGSAVYVFPPLKLIVRTWRLKRVFAFVISSSFPFVVGALAEAYGVEVLQPVALALFGTQLALWLFISRNKVKV